MIKTYKNLISEKWFSKYLMNRGIKKLLNSVANLLKLSITWSHQHHNVTNMTLADLATKYKWDSEHCSNTKTNYGNAWCIAGGQLFKYKVDRQEFSGNWVPHYVTFTKYLCANSLCTCMWYGMWWGICCGEIIEINSAIRL